MGRVPLGRSLVGLSIDVREGEPTEVTLVGELDAFSARDLRDCLRGMINADQHSIVIDCTALNFIDSTALGVLVAAMKRARHNGGDIKLRGPQPPVKQLFDLMGLSRVFDID